MATKRSRLAAVFESEQLHTTDLQGNWDLNFNVKNKFDFTENQKKFIKTLLQEDTKIVFADGFAGTAKTYLSVFGALTLIATNKMSQIIYLRSVVESANQKIGHLPGQLDEKFLPYSLPLMDKLDELVTKTTANSLFKKEYIKCLPVNFTRGLTFNNDGTKFYVTDFNSNKVNTYKLNTALKLENDLFESVMYLLSMYYR